MAKFKLIVTRTDFQLNGKKVSPRDINHNLYSQLEHVTVIEEIRFSKSGKAPLRRWLRENGFHYQSKNLYNKEVSYGLPKVASIHKI